MESESEMRTNHKDEFVKATNVETNEVKFFKNGMDASRGIGCSHVLAYKALKNEIASAYGWMLKYIAKDAAECATFKKEVEDKIRDTRQQLVEFTRNQMEKRNEIVKEAKAKRKAEHDEIVRTLRSMLASVMESVKSQLENEAIEYR